MWHPVVLMLRSTPQSYIPEESPQWPGESSASMSQIFLDFAISFGLFEFSICIQQMYISVQLKFCGRFYQPILSGQCYQPSSQAIKIVLSQQIVRTVQCCLHQVIDLVLSPKRTPASGSLIMFARSFIKQANRVGLNVSSCLMPDVMRDEPNNNR